jgi:uncharacterized paraquat-inducible protein A
MPRRIVLDSAFLSRVKKEDAAYVSTLNTMTLKKIPCKYCKCLTITKYEDLTGHFIAFCPRCGQTATYKAEDYRHYSYTPHPHPIHSITQSA